MRLELPEAEGGDDAHDGAGEEGDGGADHHVGHGADRHSAGQRRAGNVHHVHAAVSGKGESRARNYS